MVRIEKVTASEVPMDLLLLADPSRRKVEDYLKQSKCFIALMKDQTVGVCIVKRVSADIYELMNISVLQEHQKKGIGRELLKCAINFARKNKVKRLEVGTGTFGYQLAFYQREGFRADTIDKDFFIRNYEKPM